MKTTGIALRVVGEFGLDQLRFEEFVVPEPGAGEVLVRFRAASLNYRDLMVATGRYNPRMPTPRTLGSDAAGVVKAVGAGVTRWAVGDRVCSLFFQGWDHGPMPVDAPRSALGEALDGVFAMHRVLSEDGVIATPAFMTDEEASTLPCAGLTAWNALAVNGRLKAGETVLVMGTGGVSLFALQMAKAMGARVIATSSSDEKLERARALGADEGINYKTTPELGKAVVSLTGGRGVDHVVEVGGAGTLDQSLKAVRVGGDVALIGVLSEGSPDLRALLMKAIRLSGIYVGSREMFQTMNDLLVRDRIHPVIDTIFAFRDAVEALRMMESGSHFGKIVLKVE